MLQHLHTNNFPPLIFDVKQFFSLAFYHEFLEVADIDETD